MRLLILALAVICANASPQYVKTAGVKGGYGGHGYQYHGGENLVSNYSNTQHGYGGYTRTNMTEPVDYEKGVCYIEVPTASLVRDPTHVPAGNGSRPDLSRIRSCCKGFIRNIHNYRICDPVCTHECVNGLCSAPETCTCFPDHVKNLAGYCVATCPIGCQNGQCSGGECICKDGYRLDSESKFCVPYCREQCGGASGGGNCTAPNTCSCRNGYKSTPEGSCKPACDRCAGGECVGPNDCRCSSGFTKNQNGDCVPQCSTPCSPPSRCIAPNVCENLSTTTTISPYGHQPTHNTNTNNLTNPNGQQPQFPIYQQPGYPGHQQQGYPGNQQPNYPGHQQQGYPGNQQPNYPGHQQQGYPGNQQPNYPGYQPSNYTGNQPNRTKPGVQPSTYPSNPSNHYSHQPSYPGQRPLYYSNGQPIYIIYTNNQQSLYPDSQHLSPDQRPNPDDRLPNSGQPSPSNHYSNQPSYPGQRPSNYSDGQPIYVIYTSNQQPFYPDSQHLSPDQRPNPDNRLPNSGQPSPSNQYSYQPSYPGQRPSNYSDGQPIYVIYTSNQQPLYPDSQHLSPDQRPNPDNHLPNSGQSSTSNYYSHQPSYPGQRPSNYSDGQPIYVIYTSNQQPLYPDSQHLYPEQRPNPDNHLPNSGQPSLNPGAIYPNSQYYPGSQYTSSQQRPNLDNLPTNSSKPSANSGAQYPNSQYHPDQQRPDYPYGQPNSNPPQRGDNVETYNSNSQYYQNQYNSAYDHNNYQHQPNSQYPGYPQGNPQGSEYQHIYTDSQSSAVEVLCSKPCINGTCVGRDRCVCNTGYVNVASDSTGTRCEPYCTGCSNGSCVSPYVCVCNPGYFKDFSVKGRSSCVRRIRRSVDGTSAPINVADLLVFEIPEDY